MVEGNCRLAETTDTANTQVVAAARPFSRVLAHNIDALIASRRAEDQRKGPQERISDAITRFTGSLHFVYIHAANVRGLDHLETGVGPVPSDIRPELRRSGDGCVG